LIISILFLCKHSLFLLTCICQPVPSANLAILKYHSTGSEHCKNIRLLIFRNKFNRKNSKCGSTHPAGKLSKYVGLSHKSGPAARCFNSDLYSPVVIGQGIVAEIPAKTGSWYTQEGTTQHKGFVFYRTDVGRLLLTRKKTLEH